MKFLFPKSRQSHRVVEMFDIGLEKYYANFESVAWDTVIFLKNLWQTSRQPCRSVEIFVEKGISHYFQHEEEDGAFSHNLGYSETVCLYITIATLCSLQCNQNRLSIEETSTTTKKRIFLQPENNGKSTDGTVSQRTSHEGQILHQFMSQW